MTLRVTIDRFGRERKGPSFHSSSSLSLRHHYAITTHLYYWHCRKTQAEGLHRDHAFSCLHGDTNLMNYFHPLALCLCVCLQDMDWVMNCALTCILDHKRHLCVPTWNPSNQRATMSWLAQSHLLVWAELKALKAYSRKQECNNQSLYFSVSELKR